MQPKDIVEKIANDLSGVIPKSSWGETSLFYNPGKALPNGVYFCTIKEQNGTNDMASDLDRDSVFRLSIGLTKETYQKLFGQKPKRPAKGCTIESDFDFTTLNTLMPHPIYGWMSWVQILSPSKTMFADIYPLIEAAHANAMTKFNKKKPTS